MSLHAEQPFVVRMIWFKNRLRTVGICLHVIRSRFGPCTVYLFSTVRGRICKYVCLGITYFAVSQSSFIVHISFMTCLHFWQSQLQAKYASCPVPMESSIGTRESQAWITFIALYVLKPSVSALFSEKWNLLCRFWFGEMKRQRTDRWSRVLRVLSSSQSTVNQSTVNQPTSCCRQCCNCCYVCTVWNNNIFRISFEKLLTSFRTKSTI